MKKTCQLHNSLDAMGTRETLISMHVLIEQYRDVNCDVYLCLIDYQKTFDRFQHHKLVGILKDLGLDGKDLRIITNLYWNQMTFINTQGERSEAMIEHGLRQGCVSSSLLFNIYSKQILKEALEEADEGILLNGERMNYIRYADDTAVMADNFKSLQHLMTRINAVSNRYGLELNISRKFVALSTGNSLLYRKN